MRKLTRSQDAVPLVLDRDAAFDQLPSGTHRSAEMPAVSQLQTRADQSPMVARLAAIQRQADQSAVVQAVGWEDFGAANPRRYLPTLLGGYTEEQMVENGLRPAPDAPQPGPNRARNRKKKLKQKEKRRQGRQIAVAPDVETKKVNFGKEEETEADSSDLSEDEHENSSLSEWEDEERVSDVEGEDLWEGFQTVGPKRKSQSEQSRRARQERMRLAERVQESRFLQSWTAKPDQSGTRGKWGEGSHGAHEYEAEAKAAAKGGYIQDAIVSLQRAVQERKSDPNMKRNADNGHVAAIKYLENLIEELRHL